MAPYFFNQSLVPPEKPPIRRSSFKQPHVPRDLHELRWRHSLSVNQCQVLGIAHYAEVARHEVGG